jgi:3-oxoacyl-[acyl-carrier protein] reductase
MIVRNADPKVYVVTGSASGVGEATAMQLARRGDRVVINCSKSVAEAERVAAACAQAGGEAIVVQADVAKDADCKRLAQTTFDEWGRIDGLVNNAGTTKFAPMHDLSALSADDFHAIYAVNTIGAYQMVRACEAALRESRGAVVNVSSIASNQGRASSIAYAASKGALNAMTICLARSLGPAIRVNAVLPGFIETRWLQQGLGAERYAKVRADYREQAALDAVLSPDDVAATICWLLDAEKLTGQLVTIDAGRGVGVHPR